MRSETMNSTERIEAAINLEKPDRVPICPMIATSAATALTDQNYWEIVNKGYEAQMDAEIRLFDEYGGWDGVHPALTPEVYTIGGFKVKKPTKESPEIQFLESDYTKYEDYAAIAEMGWLKFVSKHLIYRISNLKPTEGLARIPEKIYEHITSNKVSQMFNLADILTLQNIFSNNTVFNLSTPIIQGWPFDMLKKLTSVLASSAEPKPKGCNQLLGEIFIGTLRAAAEYEKRGAFLIFPILNNHPFFTLSLSRSMIKFTEDLYYKPEMVEKALAKMTDEFIELSLPLCKNSGSKMVGLVEERAGAFFYPLKVFERFWWPYTEKIVDAFWSEGIKVWFHLDTSWDKNIPYFKKLPRKSAVIDLDGTTDIFAAKEQLKNHMCINSDVHPTLMSLGKPEEVTAYCRKLIDKLGVDGGHILSTGCGLPATREKENFIAMLETGRKYQLSK